MDRFIRPIEYAGKAHMVAIASTYNEILGETDYEISWPGFAPFLMVWEHGLTPGFKIQGVAPYAAHEMKEVISTVIEHYYA